MPQTYQIILTSSGTQLFLESRAGLLPSVVHWGAELGVMDLNTLATLSAAVTHTDINNGTPDAGYRLTILPEQWNGWSGHPGISGARFGRSWAPKFQVVEVEVDGRPVEGHVTAGAAVSRWIAVDEEADLRLELLVELTVQGLVRTRATLTNTGAAGYQLDQVLMAMPVPARATEVLDFAGRHCKERVPQRTGLGVSSHWREGRHGRTGADSAFVLHLGTPGFGFRHGEVWSVHTAWSGNHVHYAEKTLTGDQVIGGGELLLPGEVILASDEAYTTPWVVFACGKGLDELAHKHHGLLRSRPEPVTADRPVTLNVWEAVYFDHEPGRLIDLAERAERAGIERFVLDDGWFGARRDDHAGLGDWVVSAEVWPDGLHPLVDKVTELGMQFGLWFEPEMVNPDSHLARNHPDWVLQVPGRNPLTSRHQWVLNLGNEGAYNHVRDQMMALLDEYAIGYIKWDHNRDLFDAGSMPSGVPSVHDQTLAFYRLVDELKAAHPGLEIESCSSGGGRIDLEVMQHCDRVWVSDNIDPTDRQQMMRWTAQLLPPEMLGSHIASGASHTTGRTHSIDYRAATAVFGHLGVEWDLAKASDDELARLREWIDWYKVNREVLNAGRMVRADLDVPGAFLHGVVTEEVAIFGYTLLELPPCWSIGTIQLPGLAPEATWRVSQLALTLAHGEQPEPLELTGHQLATFGIRAPRVLPERTRILLCERVPVRM